MAEGGGEDLSKVSSGDGGKEDPDPKTQHTASAKSGKKARRKKKHKGGGGAEGVDSGAAGGGPPPLPAKRGAGEGGGGGAGGSGPTPVNVSSISTKNLQQILNKLSLEEKSRRHDFWDTQPVPKLQEKVDEVGPLEPDREDIRRDPLSLPEHFVWDDIDLLDDAQLEEVYTLLNENYVEDEDNMFRFDYSRLFLRWALLAPGWKKVWHCGVRVSSNRKLVGFISAIPALIRVKEHHQQMVEINFLCVHKKLRSKRVAPVLIKEITRRVNREGIFQAVYTAGVLLPKPVAVCQYWHRSLNPKKLVEVHFSALHKHMTLQRMIKLYRLPEEPKTLGLRPYEKKDTPIVFRMLNEYLGRFDVIPVFQSEEEMEHWILPRQDIISSYVVEDPESHEITDMMSFYHLPSTVVSHPVHKSLHVAYAFYYFSTKVPLKELMQDALILAKNGGADVFNALDLMDNKLFLEDLKFGTGDGNLHYYFYNWKCPEVPPGKVGLVLL